MRRGKKIKDRGHIIAANDGWRVLSLKDAHSSIQVLRPLVAILVAAGILAGMFVDAIATEGVSFVILVITSVVCYRIFEQRRPPGAPIFNGSTRIWALISLGFLYLAFDELLSIHEGLDKAFHWLISLEETGLSDRIDDALIFVYAVIGALLIYAHRSEFRMLGGQFRFLIVGFAFLCLGVLADGFGNRPDALELLGFEGPRLDFILRSTNIIEEILKLLAETVFLFGFLQVYRIASDENTHRRGEAAT